MILNKIIMRERLSLAGVAALAREELTTRSASSGPVDPQKRETVRTFGTQKRGN